MLSLMEESQQPAQKRSSGAFNPNPNRGAFNCATQNYSQSSSLRGEPSQVSRVLSRPPPSLIPARNKKFIPGKKNDF
jgi:hypothetical protein